MCRDPASDPPGAAGRKGVPATYEGGEYADESRQIRTVDGAVHTVETVLLDSVQSQANRMELALLRAYDRGASRCRSSRLISRAVRKTQSWLTSAGLPRSKRRTGCATLFSAIQ